MSTQVIELTEPAPGVVQIKMQDRQSKNTFSEALMVGIIEAFAKIKTNSDYKAVILTGYDSYFSSGGTEQGLHQLSDGEMLFTDKDLYSLALNCPIPVIAAMQGHGIGGGFVMGMFADFVLLSRESIYTTNFMKYGFTPGMGATLILPKKLGIVLAHEMMLGTKNYRGEELRLRGIPFTVLPRAEVLTHALELAINLAEKPRVSLVTLKDHLVKELRMELPVVIAQEVAMHEKTIHQPEVKDLIEQHFGR